MTYLNNLNNIFNNISLNDKRDAFFFNIQDIS